METKHIFIDTQQFVENHFLFDSHKLKKISELSAENKICFHITDIIRNEVISKIKNRLIEVKNAFQKFKNTSIILKNITTPEMSVLLNDPNFQTIEESIIDTFDKYITKSKIDIINNEKDSIKNVFKKYFSNTPPFGKKNKKHEFPDAFNMDALSTWCKQNGEKIYIISNDEDILNVCSQEKSFIYLSKISEFLEIYNRHVYDKIPEFAHRILENNINIVEDEIKSQFENLTFYLDEVEGEVENVEINKIEIHGIDIIDCDDASSKFSIRFLVYYNADVEYADPEFTYYDYEDKVNVVLEKKEDSLDLDTEMDAIVEIKYKMDDEYTFTLESVQFSDYSSILINSDPNWPYK